MTAEPNLPITISQGLFWSVCARSHKYCGATKYTYFQTFLRVGSVFLLFRCNKKIGQIGLLRQKGQDSVEHRSKRKILSQTLLKVFVKTESRK